MSRGASLYLGRLLVANKINSTYKLPTLILPLNKAREVASMPLRLLVNSKRVKPVLEGTQANQVALFRAHNRESNSNLFEAKTVFPFVLFADSLKIDRQKLTIVHHDFFRTSRVASTSIKDIMNIQAHVGPLFGSVTITSSHFLNNTQELQFMRRKDILIIQRLIQGFMLANQAGLATENIENKKLFLLLTELGEQNN